MHVCGLRVLWGLPCGGSGSLLDCGMSRWSLGGVCGSVHVCVYMYSVLVCRCLHVNACACVLCHFM